MAVSIWFGMKSGGGRESGRKGGREFIGSACISLLSVIANFLFYAVLNLSSHPIPTTVLCVCQTTSSHVSVLVLNFTARLYSFMHSLKSHTKPQYYLKSVMNKKNYICYTNAT